MRLLLPLAAILAVLLVACGGGDDKTESPSATTSGSPTAIASMAAVASMTAQDRSEAEALLKAATLQLEDLPSGYTLDEERFSTNEETAQEQKDNPYAPTLEDLNRFGRILSYDASYSQEVTADTTSGTLFVQITSALYQDSDGAAEALDFVRQQASDPGFADEFEQNFASSSGVQVKSATVSPMSFAKVGDDRLAFEMKITAVSPGTDTDLDFVARVVGVQRGRGIDSITVLSVGSPSPVEELEDLAHALDERMKDVFE